MKAKDLSKEKLHSGAYYTDGDDAYWLEETQKTFVAMVDAEAVGFNLHVLEKPSELGVIAEALNTISFFPSANVTIVRGGTLKLDAKKKELDTLIAGIAEDVYLLFVDADFLTPADKKKLTAIDCNKSDAFDMRDIIYSFVPKSSIESKAVDMLMEYTNKDMMRIKGELKKLADYADGKTITAQMVDDLVVNNVENSVFEFSEALSLGNTKKALIILDRFKSRGVSNVLLLSILCGQYRRMLHTTLCKKSDAELAEKLGAKEFAIKKARDATGNGKKLRPVYLKKCLDTLTTAEYNFKSGLMSEENAFQTAITKLMELQQ